jgi:aminoacrylate peracid reductase
MCEGDARAQTRHVLEVIKTTPEAAGGTMSDIAFNHTFLKEWGHYLAMTSVYTDYFPVTKPARYLIQCGLVKPDCLVGIASVAYLAT